MSAQRPINVTKGKQGFQETAKATPAVVVLADRAEANKRGGAWVIQDDSTSKILSEHGSRTDAVTAAEALPFASVGLYQPGNIYNVEQTRRLAEVSRTLDAAAQKYPEARSAEFVVRYDERDGVHDGDRYEVDALTLNDEGGNRILMDDMSDYYDLIAAADTGIGFEDKEMLFRTGQRIVNSASVHVRIR